MAQAVIRPVTKTPSTLDQIAKSASTALTQVTNKTKEAVRNIPTPVKQPTTGFTAIPNQVPKQPIQQPNQSQDYINRLKDLELKSNVAQLQAKLNSGNSALDRQQATISPMYQQQRQTANAQSQLGARSLAEFMANRGATNSGGAVGLEAKRHNALLGNINNINTAETKAFGDIAQQRTDLQNTYNTDLASGQANIEARGIQNLINQQNADRQYGLSIAGLTGDLNGARTMAGTEFDYNKQQNAIKDLVTQNSGDYMAAINNLRSQGVQDNDPRITALRSARDQKIQQINAQAKADYSNSLNDQLKQTQIGMAQLELADYPVAQALKARAMQAQIDGDILANEYKRLVNEGYPREMAMKQAESNAQVYAQRASANASSMNAQTNRMQAESSIAKDKWDMENPKATGGSSADGKFTSEDYRKTAIEMLKGGMTKDDGKAYTRSEVENYLFDTELTDAQIATILNSLPK